MSSNDGSSSGSSSSGGSSGGSSSTKVYDRTTGTWVDPAPGLVAAGVANKSLAPMPVAPSNAPKGAYLGTTPTGSSLISGGDGTASSSDGGTINLPSPSSSESSSSTTRYVPTSPPAGGKSFGGTPAAHGGSSEGGGGGRGGDAIGTTINQKAPENSGGASGGGPVDTTVTAGPRSDYSVVLAGQVGKRPDRSPYRSNNFVSLVSGAGSLGRKANESKRSLIGGA